VIDGGKEDGGGLTVIPNDRGWGNAGIFNTGPFLPAREKRDKEKPPAGVETKGIV